jgi:hypothetical protein
VTSGPSAKPGSNLLALGVAVVALVVALASGVLALYAVGKSGTATQPAAGGPARGVATTTGPAPAGGGGPPAATDAGTPAAPASPGQLDPHANYTVKYQGKQLTLHVSCNGYANYIDLDEPRVNVDSNKADLQLYCTSQEEYFQLPAGVRGADAPSATATPNDCVDAMQRAALNDQSHIPVTTQVVLCLATSYGDATTQGIKQKIAVLQVQQLAKDGTVTAVVSAWEVPS